VAVATAGARTGPRSWVEQGAATQKTANGSQIWFLPRSPQYRVIKREFRFAHPLNLPIDADILFNVPIRRRKLNHESADGAIPFLQLCAIGAQRSRCNALA
jgi:hypothetical protein